MGSRGSSSAERNAKFGVRTAGVFLLPGYPLAAGGPSWRGWMVTLSLHLLICKNGYNYIHPTVALQVNSQASSDLLN